MKNTPENKPAGADAPVFPFSLFLPGHVTGNPQTPDAAEQARNITQNAYLNLHPTAIGIYTLIPG